MRSASSPARRLLKEIRQLREEVARGSADIPCDPVAFAEICGLELDEWQRRLLSSTHPRRLLLCSRQSGKSTMAALLALHTALVKPGALVLILAPSERQAKETFGKSAAFYRKLGESISPDSYRKMGMELRNRSRIEALPGTEKTVRGFSGVDLLILDEAARVDDGLYHAVRPMLAVSGGSLMMLSTPFGKRGVFYEVWQDGEGWERYEVPASDIPRISEEFLEEERRALPAFIYRQEYECSFEEIEDQIFTQEIVERAISADVQPLFGGS